MGTQFIIYLKTLTFGLLLSLISDVSHAQTIASLDFQGMGSNPGATNPFNSGLIIDPNITTNGIEASSGLSNTSAANRFNFKGWSVNTTLDSTKYFEFEISPISGYTVNFLEFVFKGQRSNTGPSSIVIRSSLDHFATDINNAVFIFTGSGSSGAETKTLPLTDPAFQNIQSTITFRLYGFDAGAIGGTFSINNFSFIGSSSHLAVNLSHFNAQKMGENINLKWETISEENNQGFEIERSSDGKAWNNINFVPANTNNGNSIIRQEYIATDFKPLNGMNYYRLKHIGYDNEFNFSNVVKVNFRMDQSNYEIYPNPTKNKIHIIGLQGDEEVSITDFNGQKHRTLALNSTFNLNNIPAGIYLVNIKTKAGSCIQKKLIINK
ncbi:MAG TPA: T9SS type A sorting domain-containing protein [Edaphocola sp.]|nr:T9SS type A sorting domain-containing protein [Edaphocola sp.]